MLSKCPSFSYVWNHEEKTFFTAEEFLCRFLSRDHKQRMIAAYPAIKTIGDQQLKKQGASRRLPELPWDEPDTSDSVDARESMLLAKIVGPNFIADFENGLPEDLDSYLDGESWPYPVDRTNVRATVDFAVRCIGSPISQITPFAVRVGSESPATVIPTPIAGRPALVFSTSFAELHTWCLWETRRYSLESAGYFGLSALYTALLPELANSLIQRKERAGIRYADIPILARVIEDLNPDAERAKSVATGMHRFIVIHEFGHIHRHDDAQMRNAFITHQRISWEERLNWEYETDIQALAMLATREHQIWKNVRVVPGTHVGESLWDEIYWSMALEHFANLDLADPEKETVAIKRLKNLEQHIGIAPDAKKCSSRILKKHTKRVVAYRRHLPEGRSLFNDGLTLEQVRDDLLLCAAKFLEPAVEYAGIMAGGLKARDGEPDSPTLADELGLWDGAQEFMEMCTMQFLTEGF